MTISSIGVDRVWQDWVEKIHSWVELSKERVRGWRTDVDRR